MPNVRRYWEKFKYSPSVRIASGNELQPFQTKSNASASDSSVDHDLFDHAECLRRVCFIEEQSRVDIPILVLFSHHFCLFDFCFDVFVCCSPMNLRLLHVVSMSHRIISTLPPHPLIKRILLYFKVTQPTRLSPIMKSTSVACQGRLINDVDNKTKACLFLLFH